MFVKLLKLTFSTASFLFTFYGLSKLTQFLSRQPESYIEQFDDDQEGVVSKTLWILGVNTMLLCAFIIQHSVMASQFVKYIYHKLNIEDLERSIYNAASAAILLIVISNWQYISWSFIWNLSVLQDYNLSFIFNAFHFIGWIIIYSGCVMRDISELIGIKQVYYNISGRPPPMSLKSRELQRYFTHMRHPSLTGFLIILWFYPLMSIDRLLLASLLSMYMVLMWSIDQRDYHYHSLVVLRKERALSSKY